VLSLRSYAQTAPIDGSQVKQMLDGRLRRKTIIGGYMYTETFKELPIADIKDMSREDKIEYMRQWFNENYENPVNSCPYESSEGGYIYIWGGPYDAKEELDSKFSEIIEDDIIQELVDDLENESLDWSGIMNPDYDQNDYLDIFMEDKDPKNIIFEKISDLRKILDDYEKVENTQTMYHMIYAYSITALEAFLSEYFSLKILNDEDLLKKFIKTNEDFMRVSFQMNEVIEKYENIKQLVNEYLTKILWHNLAKVSNLY
jgi:hypothetical protein